MRTTSTDQHASTSPADAGITAAQFNDRGFFTTQSGYERSGAANQTWTTTGNHRRREPSAAARQGARAARQSNAANQQRHNHEQTVLSVPPDERGFFTTQRGFEHTSNSNRTWVPTTSHAQSASSIVAMAGSPNDGAETATRKSLYHFWCVLGLLALTLYACFATADTLDQAKRMHDRIAGVPPDAATLQRMSALIDAGDRHAAALIATESDSFYDVTLKNMATPWTNGEQTTFAPLNDYSATFVGFVRDELDLRELLYADTIYLGDSNLTLPAYANDNNDHYEALERTDVSLRTALVQRPQSSVTGLPATAAAGVLTTRAAARAFFYAGTNRAMLRFTLINHLCRDLEQVKDITRPPHRIRQDVTRSPGGDSRIFLNNCIGCHSGMDPLPQAFAYYEWDYDAEIDSEGEDGRLVYHTATDVDPRTGTRVQGKYHINPTNFPQGFVTPDDQWDNFWGTGQNASLGWSEALPGTGSGAASLGRELAHTRAFAQCHAERVFTTVCLRPPQDEADRTQVSTMRTNLEGRGFDLKPSFADAATYCAGE